MEFITGVITWVTTNLALILQVVGAAAAVATLTPNKSDDKIIQLILDAVNFVGGNIGKATNSPNE